MLRDGRSKREERLRRGDAISRRGGRIIRKRRRKVGGFEYECGGIEEDGALCS